jgi:murein DD-endopeptidase MepM/ murein hydrolase activator NlpD
VTATARRWLEPRRIALVGSIAAIGGLSLLLIGDGGEPTGSPQPERPTQLLPAGVAAGAELPADAPIAGWIVDGAGQPIAGASVTVDGRSVTTAGDGSFRLAATGEHTLLIAGDDVHPSEVKWRSSAPPARVLVARRIEITARVVRGGRPAAGFDVALRDGSGPARATAVSDAEGRVRFADLPQASYELSAHGPGAASRLVRVDGASEVAIELGPATDVRGRVTDDGGGAVRATVTLIPAEGDLAVRSAETDGSGGFAIDGVPAGRWEVAVEAPGHVPAASYVLEATGARSDLDLRMRRGGSVSGLVVDPAGAPVAGATLVLRRQGEGGPIAATRAPATRQLRWVHPLGGPRQMPLRDTRRFGAARDGARPAECGRGHCGVDLGGVRGSPVLAAADGIAIAVVTEIRPRAGRFVALEHAGGLRSFYMHLDEVRGDLAAGQAVRAGEPIGTLGRTGVIKSGPHLHFALAQEDRGRTWYVDPEPMLQHAIVLAPGDAIAAAAGAILAMPRGGAAAGATLAPAFITSDARGRFRIDGVAPGRYVATAFHGGLAPGASPGFEVRSAADTGGIAIELSPGVIVHGRVLGPSGAVAGARVSAEEGSGESIHSVGKATTDASGRFELRPLAGEVTLSVAAVGFGAAERRVALVARGMVSGRREENFELAAQNAEIEGLVVDASGLPVRGASVRIVAGPVRGRRAASDGSGRFSLPLVPDGRYELEASSPQHPPTRARAATGERTRIALASGGAFSLAVLDAQSRAGLAGVRIEATGPGGARAAALTDAGGRAELRPLAAGRWRIRARAAGFAAAATSAEIAAGRQEGTLELARGATLAGVVRDHNGERVAGARVSVGAAATTTDQNGAFRLAEVPSGPVEIECELGAASGRMSLTLAPGDEVVTLELRLE